MKIPENIIEEVRSSTDIVELVSEYVQLKKRGKNYVALCPFHTEKTPSFTVSPEKQMYYCFGCGKGGNVFTFLMEMDKISFVEAVKALASRAGIAVVIEQSSIEKEKSEFDVYYEICRFAGMHFYRNLTETEEGKFALAYFLQRKFSDDTIRTFGLGYSMNSWDEFLNRAKAEGFNEEDLLKVGLIRKREDGSYYDYFRGRAMFPIIAINGKVIAFGARKIRDDDPIAGKYINSPESPLYNKSKVLFGLFFAKEWIRKEDNVLMVEGYADMISLYQAGIKNVVASSGTALTTDQLALISRYTKNLTLVYDSDSAGSSATVRGIDLALEAGLNVNIVELPQGEDPDSFIKNFGKDEFLKLLDKPISFIDFKATQFKRAGAFETAEGKTNAVRSIVQSIAKIKDELKRSFFIKEISEKYDIYESILLRELEKMLNKERRKPLTYDSKQVLTKKDKPVAEGKTNNVERIPAEEQDIVKLILEGNAEIVNFILSNLNIDQFTNNRLKQLASLVLKIYSEHGVMSPDKTINMIEQEEMKSLISELVFRKYEISERWQEMDKEINEPDQMIIARDAIIKFRRKLIQKELEENQRALKNASMMHVDTTPYLHKHQELLQMLKDIESLKFEEGL